MLYAAATKKLQAEGRWGEKFICSPFSPLRDDYLRFITMILFYGLPLLAQMIQALELGAFFYTFRGVHTHIS